MPRPVARYSVTFGLAGCYMPDSASGPYAFTTRAELAQAIRDELRAYDLPASLMRQVKLRRLWAHIKAHGSSQAHVHLYHGANVLSFHGLTEEEASLMEAEQDG